MTPLKLSIVIPVHNESASLPELLEEIRRALEARGPFEVLIVDDASDDGTGKLVRRLGREWNALKLRRHKNRCGQSAAIWTGVLAARGEWIVTLDGDGQNDPADVPELIRVFEAVEGRAPFLLVAGSRRRRRDALARRLSARLANGIRGWVLGDGSRDTGCALKVFRRRDYLALPFFDHMHRFLPALFRRAGGKVLEVPVNHRPRRGGRSKYGLNDRLWAGIADLLGVLWLMKRMRIAEVIEAPDPPEQLESSVNEPPGG